MVKAKDNLGEAVISRLIGRANRGDTFIKKVRTEGNEQNHCLFYLSLKANQKRIAKRNKSESLSESKAKIKQIREDKRRQEKIREDKRR